MATMKLSIYITSPIPTKQQSEGEFQIDWLFQAQQYRKLFKIYIQCFRVSLKVGYTASGKFQNLFRKSIRVKGIQVFLLIISRIKFMIQSKISMVSSHSFLVSKGSLDYIFPITIENFLTNFEFYKKNKTTIY